MFERRLLVLLLVLVFVVADVLFVKLFDGDVVIVFIFVVVVVFDVDSHLLLRQTI